MTGPQVTIVGATGYVSDLASDGSVQTITQINGTILIETGALATAAAPTFTEGTLNTLSGDLDGNLRVSAVQTGTWNVTLTGSSSVAIDQSIPGVSNGVALASPLPAGSNIVGKIGVDQTTPGVTNGVVTLAGSTVSISQSTPGTSNLVTAEPQGPRPDGSMVAQRFGWDGGVALDQSGVFQAILMELRVISTILKSGLDTSDILDDLRADEQMALGSNETNAWT